VCFARKLRLVQGRKEGRIIAFQRYLLPPCKLSAEIALGRGLPLAKSARRHIGVMACPELGIRFADLVVERPLLKNGFARDFSI
jgi:hypothetical protein